MSEFAVPELQVPFIFRDRPAAIPADLRPEWRIALVLLLLRNCCRENRTSFARLHVLNWACRSAEGQQSLLFVLSGIADPGTLVVRIEPALNRAVDLASGEGLVDVSGGSRAELTDRGVGLADDLAAIEGILSAERQFISKIGRRLTEAAVSRILQGGI